jgi:predicted RNase H-like nuclease
MMHFEPGDLVLLNFPFTSEAGAKQRPALVLLDANDEDLLVARVTTQPYSTSFDVPISDWGGAGLIAPSTVRLHKLATVEKRLVKRRLGALQKPDLSSLRSAFERVFCQSEPPSIAIFPASAPQERVTQHPPRQRSEYVVGVDGCSGGWLTIRYDPVQARIAARVLSSFQEILACYSEASCIAIDIPIGLREDCQPRVCDLEARKVLGPRRNSVFPAPDRRLLTSGSYTEAAARSHTLCRKGISKQAFAIYPRIAEVDRIMTPELQARVVEVHPEVCFWALGGRRPMAHYKATPEGFEERRKLLSAALEKVPIPSLDEAKSCARPAQSDDVLDAIAAAWTASRFAQGQSGRLPVNPPRDSKGLRMEMVY